MKIIIHRGTHQIGGTIIECATQKTRIILEIGQTLPNLEEQANVEVIERPCVNGLFEGDDKNIHGIFVSHGHGDHIGLIPYINKEIPLYMGEKTADIYNRIERFLSATQFIKPSAFLEHEKPIITGDFTIIPYLIDHSAYDAYAFIIYAEGKSIIYTGDIREHGRKARLTQYFKSRLPENADVLLMEGTMLGRDDEQTKTEDEISHRASYIMNHTVKPVFVLQSTTNIDRLVSIYHGAKESGRLFVIDIFTANIIDAVGGSVANILRNARIIYPKRLTSRMFERGENKIMYKFAHHKITVHELNRMDSYCMLIRSSMLSILRNLSYINGSTLIYSMWKGYEARADVKSLINYAKNKKMVIKHLHTSGHGGIETLQEIERSCTPKKIVPIHTQYPERYKDLFKNVQLAVDGKGVIL